MISRQCLVDLRRTILDASVELIAKKGLQALSMREVARRVGVTHQAPYHHFKDRSDILAELMEEGFALLEQSLLEAIGRVKKPIERFEQCLSGYLDFALSRPAHFRLMFRPELAGGRKSAAIERASHRAFGVLVGVVEECRAEGLGTRLDPAALQLTAWSTAHGLASLCVDGQLGSESPKVLAAKVSATLRQLLQA